MQPALRPSLNCKALALCLVCYNQPMDFNNMALVCKGTTLNHYCNASSWYQLSHKPRYDQYLKNVSLN